MTSTNTDVKVRMISKIVTDGDTLRTDTTADGIYYKENGTYVLEYDNKEQACRTKVVVDVNSVTVTHTGAVETCMVFKNGYTHNANYGIEYGDIDMQVTTERIFVDVDSEGGSIELWYDLLLGGNPSNAKMIIEITNEI